MLLKLPFMPVKKDNSPKAMQLCQNLFSWKSNTIIWINQPQCAKHFLLLEAPLQPVQVQSDLLVNTPSTSKWKDDCLQLAQLFSQLFAQSQLALKDQDVYKRVSGTCFTWEYYMPLKQWLSYQFNLQLPTKYLIKGKDTLGWLSIAGANKKRDPKLELFPTIYPYIFYVEG
jgi:hypothetical protein